MNDKRKNADGDEFNTLLDDILRTVMDPDVEFDFPLLSDDVDSKRVKDVLYINKLMELVFQDVPGVKVTHKLHKPFRGTGSVSIEGKEIVFEDESIFLEAVNKSTCFEAYSLTNGNIVITFTFLGLMKSREETNK